MNLSSNLKDSAVLLDKWLEEYGTVIRIRGFFGVRQMLVSAFFLD
jgi:hypothetical protein